LEQVEHHPTMSTNRASLQSFAADNSLSGREVEVLRLAAEGKSDKEIGCARSVSIKTVANHTRSIYAKCRVNGRNELLAKLFSLSGS
jgi:DNA-binding CsgD family transcriptional regulator